ncbi:hypothetical protein COEREDRAFT_44674 [Coemansia reversa NRRL 1564]|uniref:DNA polymerase delta small subunit n=1 Tax=Coemansia reversa (strain ATCC 12441 / NRRL 1564) TaxID=763665 RepID=A0A2G5BA30_COERN|nr:hypothetical protein COEREDRAFT_44674 [Coemansia reversa NRRL 1564]|eukprot:PIA15587.1 hypothetical protein COEREDRAFT_44674 [Coemansia reversa NRRL 1564]
MEVDQDEVFQRTRLVTDESDKYQSEFKIGRRTYTRQYNKLYYQRLNTLKPNVHEHARRKWEGQKQQIKWTQRVLNVEGPEPTYIIGTIFIDTTAKPSTLEQVEKTHWIASPQEPETYRGEGEEVHLEDESGRIRLVGAAIDTATIASGVVAAVMGSETPDGQFDVIDMCFAGMAPQPARAVDDTQDKLVALVSGLNATVEQPVTLEMQLLAEYICGNAGGSADQRRNAQIVHTIVAGVTHIPEPPLGHTEDPRANDRVPVQGLVAAVDEYLADIAASMPLTLMPGSRDPADIALPQQPLHPGMFTQCKAYSGFRSTTNPAYFDVDGTLLLGSSGQNVEDLARYAMHDESPCQLAARSLLWRHIAPSAPDTLWCYPFTQYDPFIVRRLPHVYFFGNQPTFDVVVAKGTDAQETRVIAVPVFSTSHTVVLLNLRTLECSTVHIGGLKD